MRSARRRYVKERVSDAMACHLAGVDVYAVMNDPRLHPAHSKHAPQYLVSIRNAAGW